MEHRTISVIGIGRLGLCLAASFAKRGFDVLGVDISPEVVNAVNQGRTTISEPGLPDLLAEFAGKGLTATLSHREAIEDTDVSCIMVHTPSSDDGRFSNRYVLRALELLGRPLRTSNKPYHLFIINSTVMPGSMEGEVIPLLEETTGRKLDQGFGLCYSPELVALGSVIRDFLRPDLVAIGCSDAQAGQAAEALYRRLCENNPPVFQMSLLDAEIFKVSLNCYVTLKISFANALANLCERIPGANVDSITRARRGPSNRVGLLAGGPGFRGALFSARYQGLCGGGQASGHGALLNASRRGCQPRPGPAFSGLGPRRNPVLLREGGIGVGLGLQAQHRFDRRVVGHKAHP